MVWLPRFDEKPFSLVNANPVTLMITAVGPFSRLIHEKQPGDKLWLRGPFGQGYTIPPTHQRLALIGGGYGVAPLYWLAREQITQAESIDVIIGARTAADLLYLDRFQALTQSKIKNQKSRFTLLQKMVPSVNRDVLPMYCSPYSGLKRLTGSTRVGHMGC